jgi:hypothetical protein
LKVYAVVNKKRWTITFSEMSDDEKSRAVILWGTQDRERKPRTALIYKNVPITTRFLLLVEVTSFGLVCLHPTMLLSATNILKCFKVISALKVKVKFILEQATKSQRGSRDIAVLFH